MKAKAKHRKAAMTLVILRAGGTVEHIGTVSGGRWIDRLMARFRIWKANRKNRGA